MGAPAHDTHHEVVKNATHGIDHHGEHLAEHAAHGAHHEPHELPNFITFLNDKFSDNPIIHFLHQWETAFFAVLIASILGFFFIKAGKKTALIPGGLVNFFEMIVEALENFVVSICGENGRKHVPFIGTLFLYILLMNWAGLVPFSKSPTAVWSNTLALALIATVYIHGYGIKDLGFKNYIIHLAGDLVGKLPKSLFIVTLVMSIFLLVLNIILEVLAVPFSLSLRLFANISSEDRLIYKFASLNAQTGYIAIFLQIFASTLAILFSVIQAFVFMLLTTVYVSLFMPHEEHDHSAEAEATAH